MRYTKRKVNDIIDKIMKVVVDTGLGVENNHNAMKQIEMIKEEHLLIDRRASVLSEYTSEIVNDFLVHALPYKDLMQKYHCSFYKLMEVLHDAAEGDPRIAAEIEFRSH